MASRKEIDALQRVITVEIQKHLEKDTLARNLEWQKVQLEQTISELQHTVAILKDEKIRKENQKKARQEKRKSTA